MNNLDLEKEFMIEFQKQTEIDQIDQNSAETGNTKTQSLPFNYWCFTWNNYEIDQIDQIDQIFKHECDWYVFQEEIGENGTPHLQGTLKLKVRQRLSAIKKWCKQIHWEPTKYVSASVAYCTKEASRSGKQWIHGIKLPEPVEVEEPYGWQLDVIQLIKQRPDKRSIYWYWEPDGCVGKSELCKWLVIKQNALICGGKGNDIYHHVVKAKHRKIIVVDVPRTQLDYINYCAIENVKNGCVFSGKYESTQLVFNRPHLIVFANREPDYTAMSADRWIVKDIRTLM